MSKYRQEIEELINADFREHQREMERIFSKVAREINRDLAERMTEWGELSFSQRMNTARLQSLVLQIENQIDFVQGVQEEHIFRHLQSIAHLSYNQLFYEFEQTRGIRINFAMLPTDILETIINVPVGRIRLSERLNDGLLPELRVRLQEILVRGFTQGHGYAKMARDIREVSGMSYRRAMTIARTEGHRVTSITKQRSQQEAKARGIKLKKRWNSTLDDRTRDKHADLDGQVREVGQHFEIGGMFALQPGMFGIAEMDINCRCTTISVIEGYEPTTRQDNITGEIIEYKNYREWEKERVENQRETSTRNPRDRFVQVSQGSSSQGSAIPR